MTGWSMRLELEDFETMVELGDRLASRLGDGKNLVCSVLADRLAGDANLGRNSENSSPRSNLNLNRNPKLDPSHSPIQVKCQVKLQVRSYLERPTFSLTGWQAQPSCPSC